MKKLKQKGFALVIALAVVLITSMIGVMSIQSSFVQQHITMNSMANDKSYQAAESIIKYFLDALRVEGAYATDLILDADAGTVFHCIDKDGVFEGVANCNGKYIDTGNSVESFGFIFKRSNDYCVNWGSSDQKVSCYNILGTGLIGSLNIEVNHLQEVRVYEVSAESIGIYEF